MRDKVSPVLVMAKVRETLRDVYTMWHESNYVVVLGIPLHYSLTRNIELLSFFFLSFFF